MLWKKLNIQLKVTTIWKMQWHSDKTKMFNHCRFPVKQIFWSFLHEL
jgi:hypothetical protein